MDGRGGAGTAAARNPGGPLACGLCKHAERRAKKLWRRMCVSGDFRRGGSCVDSAASGLSKGQHSSVWAGKKSRDPAQGKRSSVLRVNRATNR